MEYTSDIEDQRKQSLKKNNEELDRICNKCCLIIGWSGVLCFLVYLVIIIIINEFGD